MTKADQIEHNFIALGIFDIAMEELYNTQGNYAQYSLRKCSATVLETKNYFILRSYDTYVSAIEKNFNICVDVLRNKCGYTPTSKQHIARFKHDFSDKNRVLTLYTWRHV